jgi:hypothetical protein
MSKKAKVVVGLQNLKPAIEEAKVQARVGEPIIVEPLGTYEVLNFITEFSKEVGSEEAVRVFNIRESGYAKMGAAKAIMSDPVVTTYQSHLRDRRALEVKISKIVEAHEAEIKATHAWKAQEKFLIEVKKLNTKQIDQLFHKLVSDNLYIWAAEEQQELKDCKYCLGLEEPEVLPMIQRADALVKEGRSMLTEANKLAPSVGLPVRQMAA